MIEEDPIFGPTTIYYKNSGFGTFRSMKSSMYAILQMITMSSWHFLPLYESMLHKFWGVTIFWFAVHFVINLILRSILAGMIWEVFIVL